MTTDSRERGTYLLILHLGTPLHGLAVGKLGHYDFAAGYYLYVGSAFGAGGLPARLTRHRQRIKQRPHWHIDYIRPYTHLEEIWSVACTQRLEEHWVQALAAVCGVEMPVRGFGASDTTMPAHLFYVPIFPPPRFLSHTLLPPELITDPTLPTLTITVQRFPISSG
jgi:Uri superfamily endonuclease